MDIEDFFATIVIGLLIGIFFTIVAQGIEAADHDTCHERGELANVKVTYRKWNGCYVDQNGLWMPYNIWKYNRDHGIVAK
jgi:hypothetical protein